MRPIAKLCLVLFAFAIPWEFSLDLGEPLGNVARIAGILVLLAGVPAIFQACRMRRPGVFCWIVLALYLWFCLTWFWTIDFMTTFEKLRAYFQEMMIVWLVWEFADTPADLRNLLRATVAGSGVLALLTLAAFRSPEAIAAGQIRFAAYGQDPNDVARFLDLGFPLAALLMRSERRWPLRLMAAGFLPLGILAVLLTASRSGFLAALVALAGSLLLLAHGHARRVAVATAFALPAFLGAVWFMVPAETLTRLATIPEQLSGGDLNQRVNIWAAGWRAFAHCAALRLRSGHLRRSLTSGADQLRAQYRAFGRGRRRAHRAVSGFAARGPGPACRVSMPRPVAHGARRLPAGLDSDLAHGHGRRKPHDMAALRRLHPRRAREPGRSAKRSRLFPSHPAAPTAPSAKILNPPRRCVTRISRQFSNQYSRTTNH